MSYHRTFSLTAVITLAVWFLSSFSTAFAGALPAALYDLDRGPLFSFPPVFDGPTEARLQSALRGERLVFCTGDERLKLLDKIDIRASLDDWRRLHYDLG